MKKYLISIATELDGHSGSESWYLQTDEQMSRKDFLSYLPKMFNAPNSNEDFTFEEYPFSADRSNDGKYYGEMVFTSQKENYIFRTPVAISVTVLPSRMSKNQIYHTESRTG